MIWQVTKAMHRCSTLSKKYQDEKAVEFHRATEYFRTLVPQIGALRVKPSEVSTCTVVE